jgi:hypothetical protein
MAKASRASRSVELERKFAVPESGLSPSFHGMSGVVSRLEQLPTQHLEATYFDTERHELAANRITLRRRSGGSDEGWHLKLPTAAGAGPEARTEVRVPLGPDLPPELRDMVLAIVRDHPLHPVARISTARDVTLLHGPDGAPLAEFCDDRVTAWRVGGADGDAGADGAGADQEQQWREWELELVDGRGKDAAKLLDRLTNRLLEAGAAPAGHASKLAKVLGAVVPTAPPPPDDPVHRAVAEQVAALLEWDRAVRADSDDAIHQMRVTIRQIRSLLQASEEEFGLTDDATILSELRELAAVLGVARDAEVLAERYRDALDALPPEMVRGPVRARLVDGGWQRYKAGLNRSLKAMRSARYFRLLDARRGPSPRHYRVRVQTSAQAGGGGRRDRHRTRARRGVARSSQGRQATSLRGGRHRTVRGLGAGQDHPDAARRSPGQRGQPDAPAGRGRRGPCRR